MGDSKAQASPTPSSLREQIHKLLVYGLSDKTSSDIANQIMSLVTSYIEAAEIDRAITELERICEIFDIVTLETIKHRLNALQAQKAELDGPAFTGKTEEILHK